MHPAPGASLLQPSPAPASNNSVEAAGAGTPAAAPNAPAPPGAFLLIGLGLLATTLGNPLWNGAGLPAGGLPLNILLKERLNFDAVQIAGFVGLAGLPWYFKPVAGALCDAMPFLGSRRRSYLLVCTAAAAVLWLALGIITPTPRTLLATLMLLTTFVMIASTVTGGLLVEAGQRFNASGRVSALRLAVTRSCDLVGASLGGWLAGRPLILLGMLGALLHSALFAGTRRWLREPPPPASTDRVGPNFRRQGRTILQARTLWGVAGMIFLVMAEPGFGLPLLFQQRDTLQFSTGFIGLLGTISAATGILAALLYGRICRRWSLRRLLAAGIGSHVVGTLAYLAYDSRTAALVVAGLSGWFFSLAILPLLDLSARVTPRGSEALGYSVIVSVMNVAVLVSNLAGSWLYSRFGLTFMDLVWLNSGTTLIAFIAVPFLPALLVDRRDG